MKKFKFSLQVLLDVRLREEKSLKNELYIAQDKQAKLEKQLELMELKISESYNRLKDVARSGARVCDIQEYYVFLEQLNLGIKQQNRLIISAQKKCDSIRVKLIEIRKTIKMLEILKEQKVQIYKNEVQADEMKVLDDFINSCIARAQ